MSMVNIAEFKHEVVGMFAHDEKIRDVLLGATTEDDDTDEMLLGDDEESCGHIYEFEYVPDINEKTDTYLNVEAITADTPTDTTCVIYLYVFVSCHKKIMQSYKRHGSVGTRVDILAGDVDALLNGSRLMKGIGKVRRLPDQIYKPVNNYYGRCITYEIEAWNQKRGSR